MQPRRSPPATKGAVLNVRKNRSMFLLGARIENIFSLRSDFFGEIVAKTTDDRRRESERMALCVKQPGVLRTDCQAARETAIQ